MLDLQDAERLAEAAKRIHEDDEHGGRLLEAPVVVVASCGGRRVASRVIARSAGLRRLARGLSHSGRRSVATKSRPTFLRRPELPAHETACSNAHSFRALSHSKHNR